MLWSGVAPIRAAPVVVHTIFIAEMPDNDVFNHLLIVAGETGNGRASYCTSRLLRFGLSLSRTDAPAPCAAPCR